MCVCVVQERGDHENEPVGRITELGLHGGVRLYRPAYRVLVGHGGLDGTFDDPWQSR